MRKITTSLIAIALSALALGLAHGQAAHAQYVNHTFVVGPGGWDLPVYAVSHEGNTDHIYTVDPGERDSAVYFGYSNLGVAFVVEKFQQSYSVPFRRFHNASATDHFYTTDPAEVNYVLSNGWVEEAPQGYIFTSPVYDEANYSIPLYRLHKWDPVTGELDHLYTVSSNTIQFARSQGWSVDGIAGYVWPAGYH